MPERYTPKQASDPFSTALQAPNMPALHSPEMDKALSLSGIASTIWSSVVATVDETPALIEGGAEDVLGYGVLPIVALYWASLRIQAEGKLKSLSPALADQLRRFYNVDLNAVHYAEGINTLLGEMAITIGNEIYFPRSVNIDTPSSPDAWWVSHELTHCEQYVRCGGVPSFFGKYIPQVVGEILAHRTFNVHDIIPLEAEANARANTVQKTLASLSTRDAKPRAGVFYLLMVNSSGQMLNVYGSSKVKGAEVIQWPNEGTENEKWMLVDAGGGYFYIVVKHSGQTLNVYGSSKEPGAKVIQWPNEHTTNEQWALIPCP